MYGRVSVLVCDVLVRWYSSDWSSRKLATLSCCHGNRTCCCGVNSVKNELSPISSSGALQSNGVSLHCISPVLLRAAPYCLPASTSVYRPLGGRGGKLKGIKIQVCRGERERSWRNRVGEKEKLTGMFSQREGGGRELAQKGRGEG